MLCRYAAHAENLNNIGIIIIIIIIGTKRLFMYHTTTSVGYLFGSDCLP